MNHVNNDLIRLVPSIFVKTEFESTVKPVYNDFPMDPKIVAVVDRWSLFKGSFML